MLHIYKKLILTRISFWSFQFIICSLDVTKYTFPFSLTSLRSVSSTLSSRYGESTKRFRSTGFKLNAWLVAVLLISFTSDIYNYICRCIFSRMVVYNLSINGTFHVFSRLSVGSSVCHQSTSVSATVVLSLGCNLILFSANGSPNDMCLSTFTAIYLSASFALCVLWVWVSIWINYVYDWNDDSPWTAWGCGGVGGGRAGVFGVGALSLFLPFPGKDGKY